VKRVTLCCLAALATPAFADDSAPAPPVESSAPVESAAPAASAASAAPTAPVAAHAPALRISVEADPLDFAVYKGWSLFSVIQPAAFGPWAIRFGTGRAYLPKAFTENGNPGWSFGFDPVTTVGVERFFRTRRGGFFAIAALGYSSMVFKGPSGATETLNAGSLQLGGGYRYYPASTLGLVFTVDAGAVNSFYRSKDPMIDGQTYKVPFVSPIAEMFVGWDFGIGK
jgi:hypothetical protein